MSELISGATMREARGVVEGGNEVAAQPGWSAESGAGRDRATGRRGLMCQLESKRASVGSAASEPDWFANHRLSTIATRSGMMATATSSVTNADSARPAKPKIRVANVECVRIVASP